VRAKAVDPFFPIKAVGEGTGLGLPVLQSLLMAAGIETTLAIS